MYLKPLKILDLFAGAGGLSLGFEMVKDKNDKKVYELFRAVEKVNYACETLRNRYGEKRVIEGDLTDKKIHNQIINDCKNKVDVIIAGIPCQSYSQIGPRSGFGTNNHKYKKDPRDYLYREFFKIVKEVKPKIIVLENVRGILSKKDTYGKLIIDKIINGLEKRLKYNLKNKKTQQKYMILNAADFGVPQRRIRVFIIGYRKEWYNVNVPYIEPTHYNIKSNNDKKNNLLPYVTLFEAIGDLPEISPKITTYRCSENEIVKISRINKNIYNGDDLIPMDKKKFKNHYSLCSISGKNFLDIIRPDGYSKIHHHIARSHQTSDIKLFELMEEGETAKYFIKREPKLGEQLIKYDMNSFDDKYRKQRTDEPCTTIFAHLAKDGNRFIHPTQARTITPREAARIQSFPDDFKFSGAFIHQFRQIGNAVPPLLAKCIGQTIYLSLPKGKIS
jgi:DNA (cytosine-5)-methyltransferase 1